MTYIVLPADAPRIRSTWIAVTSAAGFQLL